MAGLSKRLFQRSTKAKKRRSEQRSRRFRSEQLEPKLLLTRLFAINTGDNDIHEVDPANGDILATFDVPAGPNGSGLGYDGTDLWYVNEDTLFRLDPDTADVREQWTLNNDVFRDGLAVVNGLVYLQDSSVFETYDIFDPSAGSIIDTVDMEDSNAAAAIPSFVLEGMSGYNGMLLATGTDLTTEEVLFLDPATGQILDRFTVDMDFNPSGLAVIGDEIHIGSAGDSIHVHDVSGTFLRTYSLPITFDETHALGGDGVDNDLTKFGNDDSDITAPQISVNFELHDILSNDGIPDFDVNDWELLNITQPTTGSASITANGGIEFDPGNLQDGSVTFDYVAGQKVTELSSSLSSISDWYGRAVDVENDTAIVGAPLEDIGGTNTGAVFVHEIDANGDWSEMAILSPSDPDPHAQFGAALAISRDTVAVGAWIDDASGNNSGSVYIFDRDANGNWSQTTKLVGSDTTAGDLFGKSLALHGDTLVVGAEQDDPVGSASGAAYVFERDGAGAWSQTKKLVASDASAISRFGGDVSIYQHSIVVGAYRANPGGTTRIGSAYVFERNEGGAGNWGEAQQLLADDPASNDQFGYSVAIHEKQIAISAPLTEFQGSPFRSNAGSIYVFDRDASGTWNQSDKLYADDPGAGDRMGTSVTIENGTILAGSPYADVDYTDMGAAYVFQRDDTGSFAQVRKVVDPEGRKNDRLGVEVALHQTQAILGVHLGNTAVNNVGTAQAIDLAMSSASIEVTVLTQEAAWEPPSGPVAQVAEVSEVNNLNRQRRGQALRRSSRQIDLSWSASTAAGKEAHLNSTGLTNLDNVFASQT